MMLFVMDGLMVKEKSMMTYHFYKNLHQEEKKVYGQKKILKMSLDSKNKEK
jgi:hypothetical protein